MSWTLPFGLDPVPNSKRSPDRFRPSRSGVHCRGCYAVRVVRDADGSVSCPGFAHLEDVSCPLAGRRRTEHRKEDSRNNRPDKP